MWSCLPKPLTAIPHYPLKICQTYRLHWKNSANQTIKNTVTSLSQCWAEPSFSCWCIRSHQTLYPCSAGPSGRGTDAWLSPSAPISHSSPYSRRSSWRESPSAAAHSEPRCPPLIGGQRETPVAPEPAPPQSLKTDTEKDSMQTSVYLGQRGKWSLGIPNACKHPSTESQSRLQGTRLCQIKNKC